MCQICKKLRKARKSPSGLTDLHREFLLDAVGSEMEDEDKNEEEQEHLADLIEEILAPEED